MELVDVHFGAEMPKDIDYRKQADGFAEVWLYRGIEQEEDGGYKAQGVFFRTALGKDEVERQRDSYFERAVPDPTTDELAEMAYVNSELALAMMEVSE